MFALLFALLLIHADEVPVTTGLDSPLFELGMGVGLSYAPDYPGADHSSLWVIPFPFGVYRGEILHSDRRGGTRARLIKNTTLEFNISAGGGFPSNSTANEARAGMPDLEWLGEIGPRLMVDLWSAGDGRLLRMGLPLRSVFTSNFRRLTDRGFVLGPEIMYEHPRAFGTRFDAYLHLTVNFIDRRFASYFYEVHPDYATANRPQYDAHAGYMSTELSAGFMVPIRGDSLRLFTFGGVESLRGSANRESPLFRRDFDSSVSMVLLWIFAESQTRVHSED